MDGVCELRRCVKKLGFVGVRQLPRLWGVPPNDRRYYPIYAECIELGVPLCLTRRLLLYENAKSVFGL